MLKVAGTVLLLIAAAAKAVAATEGRIWAKVKGKHSSSESEEAVAVREKFTDRANLVAYAAGVVAAIFALWAL